MMNALRVTTALGLALFTAGCVSVDESGSGRYGEGSQPSAHDRDRAGWPANPDYQRKRIDVMVDDVETLIQRGDFAEARRHLDELPPLELEDGRVHLLYARVAMAEGQPSDVEWHLNEASVLMPRDGRVDLMRATFREVFGNWAAAQDAYAQAARKMPDHTDSITAQARVLLALGSTDEALQLIEREMASRPLSGELLRTSGFVKLSAGLHAEAAQDFRDAQDLLSPDGVSQETMYLALARAGLYDDIVSLVRDMDISELSPLAQYTVGHSALLAGESGLAVVAFQHWIAHDRSNPESWLDLARAHFQDGQYEAAFEAVTKVLRVRPEHKDSLVLLGHIRSRVGQYSEAMATYREAARLGVDGVVLAPVMLRLVEVMENGGGALAVAAVSSHPESTIVAFGGSRTAVSAPGTPSSGAASMAGSARTLGAVAPPPVDRMTLAELMAGSRRPLAAPREPESTAGRGAVDPVSPEEAARLLPELPDAGPAQEEPLHDFEALEMPLAAMGAEEA